MINEEVFPEIVGEKRNCLFMDRDFCPKTEVMEDINGGADGYGNWSHWDCLILESHEHYSDGELKEMGLSRP